jgi:hypothetical protein
MNKDNYKPLTGGSNSNTRLNHGKGLNQSSTIKKITLKKKKYNRKKQHTHRKYPTKRNYHTKKKYPVKKKTITKKKYRGGRPEVTHTGKRIYPENGKPYTYDEFEQFYWSPFEEDNGRSAAEKAWSVAKEALDMTGVANRWSSDGYDDEGQTTEPTGTEPTDTEPIGPPPPLYESGEGLFDIEGADNIFNKKRKALVSVGNNALVTGKGLGKVALREGKYVGKVALREGKDALAKGREVSRINTIEVVSPVCSQNLADVIVKKGILI